MEYTLYNSDGSWHGHVTCSPDSLDGMIPENGFHVEGKQHILSTCVDGALQTPSDAEVETHSNNLNLEEFREERNKRLANTDWTQTLDSPLSDTDKQNYRTLRQNLRDMPQADGFDPLNPVWPTLP